MPATREIKLSSVLKISVPKTKKTSLEMSDPFSLAMKKKMTVEK